MTGIRVIGIPADAQERQLKAHFSNPANLGGPIRQIFYPLHGNSAVILFDSPSVIMEIFKTKHYLAGHELDIFPLPRQIYEKGAMELEKGVSMVLSFHPNVIDELQYIGNLKVDFDYNRECYMLKGGWYQLEWALHLLDRTLDSVEGIRKETNEDKTDEEKVRESKQRPNSPLQKLPTLTFHSQSPALQTSKSPPLRSKSPNREPLSPQHGATGYTPETFEGYFDEEIHFPRQPMYEPDNKRGHAPVRRNKNKNVVQTKTGQIKNVTGSAVGSEVISKDKSKVLKGRGVSFGRDTDFTESKPRPRKQGPQMTSGLDVTLTNFGEKQLSFSFELNDYLKVVVVKADITKQRTDGIVSPNTPDLSNSYGVASAIARAADKRLEKECQYYIQEHGMLEMTEVMHTDAGGNLNHHVGFILHVVGPHWRETDSDASMHFLVCAYLNCFQYSETTLWLKSLSTPLISAGAYGFPLDSCIQAFFDALLIHVAHVGKSPHLQEICLVCFDSDSTGAAIMILQSLLEVDRRNSEIAALDRYETGCATFGISAKLLKSNHNKALGPRSVEEKIKINDKNASQDINLISSEESDDEEEKEVIMKKDEHRISYEATAARSPEVKIESEQPKIPSNSESELRNVFVDYAHETTGAPSKNSEEIKFPTQESGLAAFDAKESYVLEKSLTELESRQETEYTKEKTERGFNKQIENIGQNERVEVEGRESKAVNISTENYETKEKEASKEIGNGDSHEEGCTNDKDRGRLHIVDNYFEPEKEEQGKAVLSEVSANEKLHIEEAEYSDNVLFGLQADRLNDDMEKQKMDLTLEIQQMDLQGKEQSDRVHTTVLDDSKQSAFCQADVNMAEGSLVTAHDPEAVVLTKDTDALTDLTHDISVGIESETFVSENSIDALKNDSMTEATIDKHTQPDSLKDRNERNFENADNEKQVTPVIGEDFSQSQSSIVPENMIADETEENDI